MKERKRVFLNSNGSTEGELLEYFGRRAPGGRDTNFCLGASKTGEYQGGLREPKGGPRGSRWVWVPGSTRSGVLTRSDPGKTDLFSSAAFTLEESNRIIN